MPASPKKAVDNSKGEDYKASAPPVAPALFAEERRGERHHRLPLSSRDGGIVQQEDARPKYLLVKNWQKFQHYKKRRPPWIKLHRSLLEDPEFLSLSESDQWRLVKLWIIASEMEGRLPRDSRYIGRRLGIYHARSSDNLLSILEAKGFLVQELVESDASKTGAQRQRQRQSAEAECVHSGFGVSQKNPAPKNGAPLDSRHHEFVKIAYERAEHKLGHKPHWNGKDFKQLKNLLDRDKKLDAKLFESALINFEEAGDEDRFVNGTAFSLAYFCSTIDRWLPREGGGAFEGIKKLN